jgi:hypothetical protein
MITWAGPGGLWRQGDYVRLRTGTLVSLVGSQVSALAVPLTAVLTLGAGPHEMGILNATRWVPYLLFGLVAGVWVDRIRRRPLMIWVDLVRAAVVATVPVVALMNALRIEHLFIAAFCLGVLSLFFDACYQAYLPALVRREALVEGNAKLELTRSAAQVGGPSLAGALVQLVTAPLALLFDVASYLVSAAALATIRAAEAPPAAVQRRSVWREMAEGLGWVFGSPLLRPIVLNNVSRMVGVASLLGTHQLVVWYLLTAGSIAEISLRQSITPARLQGRMNTTMRSLNWGSVAFGALAGGVLGESMGIRATQVCAALWMIGACSWTLFSPLRMLRQMPAEPLAA